MRRRGRSRRQGLLQVLALCQVPPVGGVLVKEKKAIRRAVALHLARCLQCDRAVDLEEGCDYGACLYEATVRVLEETYGTAVVMEGVS